MTKYQAEVHVELELDGDADQAFSVIDEIMERAHETDRGRRWLTQKWKFTVVEGSVIEVGDLVEIGDLTDETVDDETVPAPGAETTIFVDGVCQVCGHLEGDHEPFAGTVVYTCDADNCDEDLKGHCHIGRL